MSCAEHPDVAAIAHCDSCDRAMCGECWGQTIDGEPVCDACVPLLTRPIPVVVPVVAAAVLILVALRIGWLLKAGGTWTWVGLGFVVPVVGVAAWRLTVRANARRAERSVAQRSSGPARVQGHPYRGAMARIRRRLAPPVSGAMAVFVVGCALVATAASVPALLHLPRWIEIELVLAAWWLVWTVALSLLLHRGWRVAGDRS